MESNDCSEGASTEVRCALRDILRKDVCEERKKQREAVLVGRRHIQDYGFDGDKLKPSDVEALALRLKRKQGGKEGCYKDLYSLQSALSFSGKINGIAFAKVDGAIAALVRDVSGKDSSLQLRATYCCANLALAGPDVGFKVSKAVVPYLMNHLQSMNQILLEASLRAIGSLAGSGIKAYKVMEAQGIFPRLIIIMQQCLSSDLKITAGEKHKVKLQDQQIMEAALYAASHCITVCLQDNPKLPEIEMLAVASIPFMKKVDSISLPRLIYLYFLLSCSEVSDSVFLNEDFLLKMILLLDETLKIETEVHSVLKKQGMTIEVITFIVRILGNLSCLDSGRSIMENISEIGCQVMNNLLKHLDCLPQHITKETLWFLMHLLDPYSEWVNGAFHVRDCPWTPIVDSLKFCLEQKVIADPSCCASNVGSI